MLCWCGCVAAGHPQDGGGGAHHPEVPMTEGPLACDANAWDLRAMRLAPHAWTECDRSNCGTRTATRTYHNWRCCVLGSVCACKEEKLGVVMLLSVLFFWTLHCTGSWSHLLSKHAEVLVHAGSSTAPTPCPRPCPGAPCPPSVLCLLLKSPTLLPAFFLLPVYNRLSPPLCTPSGLAPACCCCCWDCSRPSLGSSLPTTE